MKVIFPIIKLNYCLWYSWFGYNLSPMISYECEVKIASDSAALGKKRWKQKRSATNKSEESRKSGTNIGVLSKKKFLTFCDFQLFRYWIFR